jgi:Arc/MetJ-type ribon-helix-helix transcriptional regulator
MKGYIHARLSEDDRAVLEELKKSTRRSESELVREGLRLVRRQLERGSNALELAGKSSGKFAGAPKDLSTNRKHLAEFGR